MSDPLPWWATTVNWLLIIAGWLVINHQHNLRVTRNEVRASIDKLISAVDELVALAIEYHTNPRNRKLETTIKSRLSRLASSVTRLKPALVTDTSSQMASFRQAITLDNFEAQDHRPLVDDDIQLIAIYDAGHHLIEYIEYSYCQIYQTSLFRKALWCCRKQDVESV